MATENLIRPIDYSYFDPKSVAASQVCSMHGVNYCKETPKYMTLHPTQGRQSLCVRAAIEYLQRVKQTD